MKRFIDLYTYIHVHTDKAYQLAEREPLLKRKVLKIFVNQSMIFLWKKTIIIGLPLEIFGSARIPPRNAIISVLSDHNCSVASRLTRLTGFSINFILNIIPSIHKGTQSSEYIDNHRQRRTHNLIKIRLIFTDGTKELMTDVLYNRNSKKPY